MFTHRFSIRKNNKVQIEIETISRGMSVNVSNLVLRMQAAGAGSTDPAATEVTCENGVCTLNWKPQRPAA